MNAMKEKAEEAKSKNDAKEEEAVKKREKAEEERKKQEEAEDIAQFADLAKGAGMKIDPSFLNGVADGSNSLDAKPPSEEGSTQLVQNAFPGKKDVKVQDSEGFEKGDCIKIGDEEAQVKKVKAPLAEEKGTHTLFIKKALQKKHPK